MNASHSPNERRRSASAILRLVLRVTSMLLLMNWNGLVMRSANPFFSATTVTIDLAVALVLAVVVVMPAAAEEGR